MAPPPYKDQIEYILAFANADLTDEETVDALNAEPRIDSLMRRSAELWLAFPRPPRRLDKNAERSQRRLRTLLDDLASSATNTGDVAAYVERILPKTMPLAGHQLLRLTDSGEYILWAQAIARTTPQWFCFGLDRLLKDGLVDRIGKCALDECSRYFVAWPGARGRAGKDQRFCCRSHGSIDKQRRYRRRRRQVNELRFTQHASGNLR